MAHDVIMPMLGMVQDTGIIVSWHKQLGDAVKASDILMEVETDKATVEIEAGFDGFVTALRADTGVPVPVGQVVAVISDDKSEIEAAPADTAPEPPAAEAAEPPAAESTPPAATDGDTAPAPGPAPAPTTRRQATAPGGRILASPKARRLARERGVDLGRLVRLGVPEPIHVADLDKAGPDAAASLSSSSLMRVTIDRAPFEDFFTWVGDEAGIDVESINIWAAFAAGSFRVATGRGHDEEIIVEVSRFPQTDDTTTLKSPDRLPLSAIAAESTAPMAALTMLDLTGTMLTDYRRAGEAALPFLTICNSQDAANIDLYLEFDPAAMPAAMAYDFLKELADRSQVPLRHVL